MWGDVGRCGEMWGGSTSARRRVGLAIADRHHTVCCVTFDCAAMAPNSHPCMKSPDDTRAVARSPPAARALRGSGTYVRHRGRGGRTALYARLFRAPREDAGHKNTRTPANHGRMYSGRRVLSSAGWKACLRCQRLGAGAPRAAAATPPPSAAPSLRPRRPGRRSRGLRCARRRRQMPCRVGAAPVVHGWRRRRTSCEAPRAKLPWRARRA